MSAILVTGGAGYIGSHTCVELLERGYEVVAADNLVNASPRALDRVREITGRELRFYRADVRDAAAMDRIFTEQEIGCVIHFAGLKAVGESVGKPLEYYENNLHSTLVLADAMRRHGVKRFIFSSSATVYALGRQPVLSEESALGECTNPYSWSKFMIEQILRDWAKAQKDMSVVLLRYFNPIGAHPSGLMGEDPRGIPNNLLPFITQVAVGRREKLNVFGNDYPTRDGTCIRDYIHVMDLAAGHVSAIRYAETHTGCEGFNLGTGVGYSVLEVVRAFEKANALKLPYAIVGRRAGDMPEFYASPEKSERLLGWKARYSLEDMCRHSWNWQKQNPYGYRTAEEARQEDGE